MINLQEYSSAPAEVTDERLTKLISFVADTLESQFILFRSNLGFRPRARRKFYCDRQKNGPNV